MGISNLAQSNLHPGSGQQEWAEYLRNYIDFTDWRTDEFNADSLVLAPNPANPRTFIKHCDRDGCTILMATGTVCPSCRTEFKRATQNTGISIEAFLRTPREPRIFRKPTPCAVSNCARRSYYGELCVTHRSTYLLYVANKRRSATVSDWLAVRKPTDPPPILPQCRVHLCPFDGSETTRLCRKHAERYTKASRSRNWLTIDDWIDTLVEPYIDLDLNTSYAASCATPFALLPQPLRWELLHAIQQRDREGRAGLHAMMLRTLFVRLRSTGITTLVGKTMCDWDRPAHSNMRGFLKSMQWHIDEAHRMWSGPDAQNPHIVPFRDLTLRTSRTTMYRTPTVDMSNVTHKWIADAVIAWVRVPGRSPAQLGEVQRAWQTVDKVIPTDPQSPSTLTSEDMDAVVKSLLTLSASRGVQKRMIRAIKMVTDFARADPRLRKIWDEIPPGFSISPGIHRPKPPLDSAPEFRDEPFRYVPQPVVDWVMDHLGRLKFTTDYKTAEARVMVYLHERCGRRPGETVALRDDCVSYDSDGLPYLEWRQGKPPYKQGKRLPIHQETHDAIREWQRIKLENGSNSQWLFPSSAWAAHDTHYQSSVLQKRVKRLVEDLAENAPFPGEVEGAEGNLIYFDLKTIDAYAFRHAFAQRLADSVDESGRSTTPPDVLQAAMGHSEFRTTMGYFEVTARRRRRALGTLPTRKLDIRGHQVGAAKERDDYQRIGLSVGSCSEPQNVASAGRSCALEHTCESCPFFLVDPLDREGIVSRRTNLEVQRERAAVIHSPRYFLDFLEARISDCESVIDGIDDYVQGLPPDQRNEIISALESIADVRRRATAPRMLNLRELLQKSA